MRAVQVKRARHFCDDHTGKLKQHKKTIEKLAVPNQRAAMRDQWTRCDEELHELDRCLSQATATKDGPLEQVPEDVRVALEVASQCLAELEGALANTPPEKFVRRANSVYIPPPELEEILQQLIRDCDPWPVCIRGSPDLGKSAAARALFDRYSKVRLLGVGTCQHSAASGPSN